MIIKRWRSAAEEMGLKMDFTGHSVRRTVVKQLRDLGCSKSYTSKFVGHAKGSKTTELYDEAAALRKDDFDNDHIKNKKKMKMFNKPTSPFN